MKESVSGTLSIQYDGRFYSTRFETEGWIAAELVQYLDDLYRSESIKAGILKLLGYTLQITDRPPSRSADHWVEIELDARVLSTNSDLIRKAVKQQSVSEEEPYWEPVLRRVYSVLDSLDFTVRLVE